MGKVQGEMGLAAYRAGMYRAVSAAFVEEPTREGLLALVEAGRAARREDCALECEHALLCALGSLGGTDPEALRTQVASEYAELFVGPRAPRAPLYESVYADSRERLFTGVTDSVRKFYERNGFEVVRRNRVPDDHLGYECEFMANLCEREQACLDAGDEQGARLAGRLQARFLTMHLAAWTGAFRSRVEQAGCSAYYTAWARFIDEFAGWDLDGMINPGEGA